MTASYRNLISLFVSVHPTGTINQMDFYPEPSTLWSLQKEDKIASCEVRFVPNGTEIRVTRNRQLLWSRIFENGDDALKEAAEERERMMGCGWTNHAAM